MRWLRIWGHHSLCADLLTAHDCLKLIRVFCDSFHAPAATSMRNVLLFASSPSVCTLAFVNVSHLSMYSFYIFFFSFALRPHSALFFFWCAFSLLLLVLQSFFFLVFFFFSTVLSLFVSSSSSSPPLLFCSGN